MTPAVSSYQPTPSQPPPAFEAPAPPSASSDTVSSGANPLLRRGRAVDPSISAPVGFGGNYGGGYMQPQQPPVSDPYSYGGGQQFHDPAMTAPAPAIFTPESPVSGGQNLLGASGQQFTSTPSGQHVPDQPGPGYSPAVSNGSGWNDPPPLMTKAQSKQESNVTSAITQPLLGAPEPTQPPSAGPGGWAGFQPAPVPQQQPSAPAPSYQGGYFQPQEPAPPANQPAPAPVAAPPAPIPAEHQVIQDTLESLRSKCQQGKSNIDDTV